MAKTSAEEGLRSRVLSSSALVENADEKLPHRGRWYVSIPLRGASDQQISGKVQRSTCRDAIYCGRRKSFDPNRCRLIRIDMIDVASVVRRLWASLSIHGSGQVSLYTALSEYREVFEQVRLTIRIFICYFFYLRHDQPLRRQLSTARVEMACDRDCGRQMKPLFLLMCHP